MPTVLVTGGAGFIGSHFVEWLLANSDWKVTVLDGLTYAGDMERLTSIEGFDPDRVKTIWHDLKAPISERVSRRLGTPEYIVHFAAMSHVDHSIDEPLDTILANTACTAHLLEWIRVSTKTTDGGCYWQNGPMLAELKHVIQFSTDEVYGPAAPGKMSKEWDPIIPSNPYSASKANQENNAIAYWRTYALPITIVNVMNVIGERQGPEKFMSKTMRAVAKHEQVTVHGRPPTRGAPGAGFEASSRVWIHAKEIADALYMLLQRTPARYGDEGVDRPDRWHVAGPEEVDVYTMAEWVSEAMGMDLWVKWEDYHSSRPGHDHRYALDASKIAQELGWTPKRSTREAVESIVHWTQAHEEWLS